MACADIAVALLAAGRSTRFGSNKLETPVEGRMLGLWGAETIAAMGFETMLAVTNPQSPHLSAALAALNYQLIENDHASAGLSHSLHLAVRAAAQTDAQALLICLADMPYVTADHLDRLVTAYREDLGPVASGNAEVRTPPAIFPRALWPALLETSGDQGAGRLIAEVRIVGAASGLLCDIDTPGDLSR